MPRKKAPSQPLSYNIRPAQRIFPTKIRVKRKLKDLTDEQIRQLDIPLTATEDTLAEVTVPLDENTWIESGGDWLPVISTNVAAIKYDQHARNMYVKFKSGREYIYFNVNDYMAMRTFVASSMGKHIWAFRPSLVEGRDYQRIK